MATVNLQVGASADDGYWDNTGGGFSFNTTTNSHEWCSVFGGNQWSGFYRFTSVAIAQGATITTAEFVVTAYANESGTTAKMNFHCEDSDDATAPTSYAEATGLTLTTANTSETSLASYTANTEYTYDVTSAVQEVINRVGWSSGNAIMVCAISPSDSSARRQVYDYTGDSSKAAKLNITYSSGVTRRAILIT